MVQKMFMQNNDLNDKLLRNSLIKLTIKLISAPMLLTVHNSIF
jgi:hypothetical protein